MTKHTVIFAAFIGLVATAGLTNNASAMSAGGRKSGG